MATDAARTENVDRQAAYASAFTDWLACACAGQDERAARAVRATGDDLVADVAFAATAGHVLDYDDTFADGVAHVSAACAPAALVLGAHLGLSAGAVLDAYAEGYEAMAAVASSSHPALYDAGWHPTAVCAPIGAAVAASRLFGLPEHQRENALALAVLRAGGARGAFGSDGKAIQVGLATAAGVQAVLLARAGASVHPRAIHGPVGFRAVMGATWALGRAGPAAIERNWIKLHPSCLGTHSPIDAAASVRERSVELDRERLEVRVHPLARQAAHLDEPGDGLSAKFSIPYCVAHTLLHGPPGVREFESIDRTVLERGREVRVAVDGELAEFGAVLTASGEELARVDAPRGAPERPVTASELAVKVSDLAGDRLDGILEDVEAPASGVLEAAGLVGAASPG